MTHIKPLQVELSPGFVAMAGPIPPTAEHKHHALQISVALRGKLWLNGQEASTCLVGSNVPHTLKAEDALTLLVGPETHAASGLLERLGPDGVAVLGSLEMTESPQAVLNALAGRCCVQSHGDPRIEAVVHWLEPLIEQGRWEEVSLAEAAKRACLSKSRFLHVYRDSAGMPWRASLVWRRAIAALSYAFEGHSLTAAAHYAGYTDSAHFSRQIKSLFGLTPRVILAIATLAPIEMPAK